MDEWYLMSSCFSREKPNLFPSTLHPFLVLSHLIWLFVLIRCRTNTNTYLVQFLQRRERGGVSALALCDVRQMQRNARLGPRSTLGSRSRLREVVTISCFYPLPFLLREKGRWDVNRCYISASSSYINNTSSSSCLSSTSFALLGTRNQIST